MILIVHILIYCSVTERRQRYQMEKGDRISRQKLYPHLTFYWKTLHPSWYYYQGKKSFQILPLRSVVTLRFYLFLNVKTPTDTLLLLTHWDRKSMGEVENLSGLLILYKRMTSVLNQYILTILFNVHNTDFYLRRPQPFIQVTWRFVAFHSLRSRQ